MHHNKSEYIFAEITETIMRNVTHTCGKPVLNYLRWLREVKDIEEGEKVLLYLSRG